ncbi:hypothetical protein LTR66_002800 [Elasticomyces elasticus]|nr:hypothetical protein LTR66_002800 [Elasticomyces elasticus]
MCKPDAPAPDIGTPITTVPPHFSLTPSICELSHNHHSYPIEVVRHFTAQLNAICNAHRFKRCDHRGVYRIGDRAEQVRRHAAGEDPGWVVAIVELNQRNMKSWWEIDGEVRKALAELEPNQLRLCLRYYVRDETRRLVVGHWTSPDDVMVEGLEEDEDGDSEQTTYR